jgi:hypothetical protein
MARISSTEWTCRNADCRHRALVQNVKSSSWSGDEDRQYRRGILAATTSEARHNRSGVLKGAVRAMLPPHASKVKRECRSSFTAIASPSDAALPDALRLLERPEKRQQLRKARAGRLRSSHPTGRSPQVPGARFCPCRLDPLIGIGGRYLRGERLRAAVKGHAGNWRRRRLSHIETQLKLD